MPFGPATIVSKYYRDMQDCLQETDDMFGLVILEIFQQCDRDNQINPLKTPLSKGTIITMLSQWTMTNRPNDYTLRENFEAKVEDAWRWLHKSELIKPAPGMNGQNGYVVLTDLGRQTTRDQRALLEASRVLPENLVHPRIFARIRADFRRGVLR
jgi:hypothetical protein